MDLWLKILIGSLIVVLLIAIIYSIFVLRKASIVIKKIDMLTEDLIYKSDTLNPAVETLAKISNLSNHLDSLSDISKSDIENFNLENEKIIKKTKNNFSKLINKNNHD
ncbi:MAG: hypothetical protein ACRDCG_02510 [Mycoplasmoidaceae bacterium]